MDRFSFFFAFYGLILGLAVTEILGGYGRFVRARPAHKLEMQTALMALFAFLSIAAAWIDAFTTLQSVQLNFSSLWTPVLNATFYYLAATVLFPSDPAEFDHLAEYFAKRKRFIVGMLFACELLATYNFLPQIIAGFHHEPAAFWMFYLPYNVALKGSYIALLVVRSRRANIACLVLLILLFLLLYWENGAIASAIQQRFGAS